MAGFPIKDFGNDTAMANLMDSNEGNQRMKEGIIFAGFGGQGIMVMGKVLAWAAMREGLNVSWMPSYGAEVRGGTAHSMVVISDEMIPSPVVANPTACVVMNRPSLDRFEDMVLPSGILVVNSTLIDRQPAREDLNIFKIPLTQMATKLGNVRCANMIALGVLNAKLKIVSMRLLAEAIKEVIPSHKHNLVALNEEALKEGARLVSGVVGKN
ncbi:MAG: 2-oxoacid:acceptor oxidoreductase family protein [Candidatus Omnitrophota bacterium]